jgi:glycosyltransferase involved in cell wall biosynthesis
VEKENSGYGGVRQRGIAVARGEYIGIVETDDFISRKMYEKLILWQKAGTASISSNRTIGNYFDAEGLPTKKKAQS